MGKSEDKIAIEPLNRQDIARGFIFLMSFYLIFLSFSSDNFSFGIVCLFCSLFFFSILFNVDDYSVRNNYDEY